LSIAIASGLNRQNKRGRVRGLVKQGGGGDRGNSLSSRDNLGAKGLEEYTMSLVIWSKQNGNLGELTESKRNAEKMRTRGVNKVGIPGVQAESSGSYHMLSTVSRSKILSTGTFKGRNGGIRVEGE